MKQAAEKKEPMQQDLLRHAAIRLFPEAQRWEDQKKTEDEV